jgi:hypothetical protein
MKAQIYILAFYILLLAITPCKDAFHVACNDANQNFSSQTASRDCRHDIDLCSPLCTCNCCASAISKIKVVHFFSVPQRIIQSFVSPYLADVVSVSPDPIWQPPKK